MPVKTSAERIEQIRTLRSGGATLQAIAETLGTDRTTVKKYCQDMPTPRPVRAPRPAGEARTPRPVIGSRSLRRLPEPPEVELLDPEPPGIEFLNVRAYTCPGCRLRVTLAPCAVCAATGTGRPREDAPGDDPDWAGTRTLIAETVEQDAPPPPLPPPPLPRPGDELARELVARRLFPVLFGYSCRPKRGYGRQVGAPRPPEFSPEELDRIADEVLLAGRRIA